MRGEAGSVCGIAPRTFEKPLTSRVQNCAFVFVVAWLLSVFGVCRGAALRWATDASTLKHTEQTKKKPGAFSTENAETAAKKEPPKEKRPATAAEVALPLTLN